MFLRYVLGVLGVLGVFGEFETNLRKERQKGVYKGRKPFVDVEEGQGAP